MDDGPANIVVVPASMADACFSTDDALASIVGECSTDADASSSDVDACRRNDGLQAKMDSEGSIEAGIA